VLFRSEFEIVPFPINYPHLLKYYVPLDANFFVTVYDDWGREKVKILEQLGVEVEVMWERTLSERLTTGTEVRKLIAIEEEWQHLVPQAVARIIRDLKLEKRVQEIKNIENFNSSVQY
jgi:nicotinamide mononucleotide adenylyltransferase